MRFTYSDRLWNVKITWQCAVIDFTYYRLISVLKEHSNIPSMEDLVSLIHVNILINHSKKINRSPKKQFPWKTPEKRWIKKVRLFNGVVWSRQKSKDIRYVAWKSKSQCISRGFDIKKQHFFLKIIMPSNTCILSNLYLSCVIHDLILFLFY